MTRAALYRGGLPCKIMTGSIDQLNAQILDGGTWREISEAIETVGAIPDFSSIRPHLGLIEFSPMGGLFPAVLVEPLEQAIRRLCEAIDGERDKRMLNPVSIDGTTIDGDDASQKNILGAATLAMIALASGEAFSLQWITLENQIVNLSGAQIEAFAKAMAARREADYMAARIAKDEVRAASSVGVAEAAFSAYTLTAVENQ
jgi:hypothetical protein